MTDYNDGKWHGWNGGECPVHPKTRVAYVLKGGLGSSDGWGSGDLQWGHTGRRDSIVAFRVVNEYKEPREFWVNEYPASLGQPYDSRAEADERSALARIRCIHVREVIE